MSKPPNSIVVGVSETNRAKGNVLEDLVALLHETGTGRPEARVRLPATSDPQRMREIDVLLRHQIAGDPVLLVFECKNERDPVGAEYVDAFFGKLYDIGVPPSQGIFVSPIGYTRGALGRAAACGIKLLVLDGLNAERMAASVNEALLSVVHFVLYVTSVSMFSYLPSDAPGDALPEGWEHNPPRLYDYIWRRWIRGTLPHTVGEHLIPVRAGVAGAILDCRVCAYVGTASGTSKNIVLREAPCGQLHRARVDTEFQLPASLSLRAFQTEEQLATVLSSEAKTAVVHRVRVPRIVVDSLFWPPSTEAVVRIRELIANGEEVTFARVEGQDLARAWINFEQPEDPSTT